MIKLNISFTRTIYMWGYYLEYTSNFETTAYFTQGYNLKVS